MNTRATGLTLLAALVAVPWSIGSAAAASATSSSQPTVPLNSTTSAVASSSSPSSVSTSATPSAPASTTPSSPVSTSSSQAAPAYTAPARRAMSRMAVSAAPPAISVGSHVSRAVNSSVLGAPVAAEGHWTSAGGGWIQQFKNGWALVSDGGQVGMVTGSLLPYFTSHGYVNATGWPVGNAVTDSHGTYQKFDSKGHSIWGALVTTPSGGVVRVGMGMYNTYFGGNLRGTLGAPLDEEIASWKAGGGGHAQNFQNGWVTYQSMRVTGWFPHNFTFAQLDFANKGWPTSGAFAACGAQKVNQSHGYTATGGRWCPNSSVAHPVTAIARPNMPAALYAGNGTTKNPGDSGINVMLVQDKLGFARNTQVEELLAGSKTVRALMSRFGTSTITPATFARLGITTPWNVGTAPQPVSSNVSMASTRNARISEMIRFIEAQKGLKYTYGSAGPLQYGADCSGLVLAALQDAGVQTKANVLDDIKSPSKLTQALFNDTSLDFIRWNGKASTLQPGDLIFYTNSGTADGIHHVAMYVGNGRIFDTEAHGHVANFGGLTDPMMATDQFIYTVKRLPQ